MKKYRWLAAAGALTLVGGFVSHSTSSAGAAVTIDPKTTDKITCNLAAGAAKVSPGLADDWVQADHQSDPGDINGSTAGGEGNETVTDSVASIPDTTYSPGAVPITTSAKLATVSCSGTLHDKTTAATDTISSASISTSFTSVPEEDSTGSCKALVADGPGDQSVTSTIKWKTAGGAKVADTVITSSIAQSGGGFGLTSTNVDGAFDGGTSFAQANVAGPTLFDLLTTASTSDPDATALGSTGLCSPHISLKFTPAGPGVGDAVSVKLKKPKSLKAINIDASGSTICVRGSAGAAC